MLSVKEKGHGKRRNIKTRWSFQPTHRHTTEDETLWMRPGQCWIVRSGRKRRYILAKTVLSQSPNGVAHYAAGCDSHYRHHHHNYTSVVHCGVLPTRDAAQHRGREFGTTKLLVYPLHGPAAANGGRTPTAGPCVGSAPPVEEV